MLKEGSETQREVLPLAWKKGSSVFAFSVCMYLCSRPTGHNFRLRNLIFGMMVPWDMSKKGFFQFFEILYFSRFRAIFRVFSYITVMLSVCMFVRGLQFTIFELGTWFSVWGYLGTWGRKVFFSFSKFWFFRVLEQIFEFFRLSVCLFAAYRSQFLT